MRYDFRFSWINHGCYWLSIPKNTRLDCCLIHGYVERHKRPEPVFVLSGLL